MNETAAWPCGPLPRQGVRWGKSSLPIGQTLIAAYGWVLALGGLVAIAFLMVPLAAALAPSERKSPKELKGQLIIHVLAEAGLHRGY